MFVVIALGGNALLKRGEPMSAEAQRRNVRVATDAIAAIAKQHRLVVTHGNGPQVGLLAEQTVRAHGDASFPLDVLGAESQGMIGYVLEAELAARLPGREIASLLTQVVVDPRDRAFESPAKPIGPVYDETESKQLSARFGWTFMRDGQGYRRAVASPVPLHIREIGTIRILVEAGVIVICAGGGGVPVAVDDDSGAVIGIEAVVDKDRSASLLARELGADRLLILTDVPAAYTDWGTPKARAIREATPSALARYRFAEGSMGPKVEAAATFVASTGGVAVIGALADARAMLRDAAGTRIRPGKEEIAFY